MRALALVCLLGCGAAQRAPAWERAGLPFGAVSPEILDDMVRKGDETFAKREDPAMLDDAVENWLGALRYRPDDATLMVRLSRAARLRAHTAGDANARANKAVVYAERALATRNWPLYQRAVDRRRSPGQVFAAAELADVPALVAYAEALLDWAERHGPATLMSQRDWILAAAVRAAQLDRTADFGAPDRVIAMASGDLQASERHFQAALQIAPAYLPTRLEFALRLRAHDPARARRLLKEVTNGDAAALPENRAAQERARQLLADSW